MKNSSCNPMRCGRIACLVLPALQDQRAWERVLEILAAYSPLVEEGTIDAVHGAVTYLDASGVAPRYGSEEAWCREILQEIGEGLLGLASSKYAAWVAAQTAPAEARYRVVVEPDRQFLAALPALWLPLSAEVQRRLLMLGIRTVGRFAGLPPSAVAEQFAPENLVVHRWARGLDDRPVIGRRCQVVQARADFEVPEDRRDALVQVGMQLSYRALEDLPVSPRAWAVKRIELHATFAEGAQVERSVWLDDTPGQQTLRALLGGMVDSLKEEKDLTPRHKGHQEHQEHEGFLGSGAMFHLRPGSIGTSSRGYAEAGDSCAGWGIMELTVRLLGLEPAQGRQMDLFASIETRRRLEQTLQQLARKHAACVALVVALDVEAPILGERYAFMVQDAYSSSGLSAIG